MRIRPIKTIRQALGVTQTELAEALHCTQVNVSLYERGQSIPPVTAGLLIAYAKGRGLALTFGMVYGAEPLPAVQRVQVMGVTL
jgi:putative transcriptional regulator